jgi:hypothetical protein
MPAHFWKVLPTLAVISLSTGAHGQSHDELSAMVSGPWHHVPDARSGLEFNREMAKCRVASAQTPINSTTPAVVEIVRWTVLVNCLKASGYEPGVVPARNAASRKDQHPAATGVKMAGRGPGISPCSQYNESRRDDLEEHVFFTWAEGFLTGYNIQAKSAEMIELSALTDGEQLQFIRGYCDQHPDKRYIEAVVALIQALRTAQQANRNAHGEQ